MNKKSEPATAMQPAFTERTLREKLGAYTAPQGLYERNKARPFVGKVTCSVDRLLAGRWDEIVLAYDYGGAGGAARRWV